MAQPKERRLTTEAALEVALAENAGTFKVLAASMSVDDLTDGVYRVPSATVAGQLGLPYTAAGGELTQVTSNTHVRQTYAPVTPIGQVQTWQRRRVSGVWEAWERQPWAATSISTDPYAPLNDGHTLLVISDDHAATVWPTGISGFTAMFGDGKFAWRTRGDGRGEVYTLNMANRRALTWDRFNNTRDVDVTGMAEITNATDGTFGGGVAARVSGDHDDRNCVFAVIRRGGETGDQLAIITTRNGGTTIHTTVDFPWSIGDTVLVRLRVQGADARAKAWKLGQREPTEWMAEAVTPLTDVGAVGIYAHGIHARHQGLEVAAL